MISEQVLRKERFLKVKQMLIGCLCAVGIIFLRLFYLQVTEQRNFSKLGEKNFIKTEVVPPLRGNFYDVNNLLLAANRPVFDLYWQGDQAGAQLQDEHHKVIERIAELLGKKKEDFSLGAIKFAQRYALRSLLHKDLTFEQLCMLSEQCFDCSCLLIKNRFERVYPYKTLASHLLGYLSRAEKVGCTGLEKVFNAELAGKEGAVSSVINSVGKPLSMLDVKAPQPGVDLQLTLDFELQTVAESLFEPGQSGSFILMDAETGAIKVLLSYPNFDPNVFLQPISEEQWENNFSENNPLLNRVTFSLCPPASIFKLVTLAAGMEEGLITPDSVIYCPGYLEFHKRKYMCKKRTGHGHLNVIEGLAASCNVHCYEMARLIHIDKLADYAFRFGLGVKTNFLLPERTGLIPTTAWKRQAKQESWWAGETLSVSIGQSYLLVTPLQVARMLAAIATGYLVKPRALEQEEVERAPLGVSHKTLAFLRESMKRTVRVKVGTGRRLAHFKDFELYAKTGTAQTCSLSVEQTERRHLEHAWLASFFSYKGGKPLVLVVQVEHAGSSRVAVELAERFLRAYRTIQELK